MCLRIFVERKLNERLAGLCRGVHFFDVEPLIDKYYKHLNTLREMLHMHFLRQPLRSWTEFNGI